MRRFVSAGCLLIGVTGTGVDSDAEASTRAPTGSVAEICSAYDASGEMLLSVDNGELPQELEAAMGMLRALDRKQEFDNAARSYDALLQNIERVRGTSENVLVFVADKSDILSAIYTNYLFHDPSLDHVLKQYSIVYFDATRVDDEVRKALDKLSVLAPAVIYVSVRDGEHPEFRKSIVRRCIDPEYFKEWLQANENDAGSKRPDRRN